MLIVCDILEVSDPRYSSIGSWPLTSRSFKTAFVPVAPMIRYSRKLASVLYARRSAIVSPAARFQGVAYHLLVRKQPSRGAPKHQPMPASYILEPVYPITRRVAP